jgi:signal transduction histidine kinase
MNFYYSISAFVNGITSLVLSCFVFLKNRNSEINKKFVQFGLAVTFWSFSLFIWSLANNKHSALLWARLLITGATFIPPTFLYFVFILVGKDVRNINIKKIIYCNYILAVLFVIINFFTPYFIVDVREKLSFKFWPHPGMLFIPFFAYFISNVIYSHLLMYKSIKTELSATKRNQIKYVFWGTLLGFIGGSSNYFLFYDIKIPPVANILVTLYVCTVAYAITRYHLMEIEVIIKKSLVFAGMFVFAFGVFVTITLLVSRLIGGSSIISLAISALIITIFLRSLETWLVNATDKFLFQKKYEYKQILKAFIDEVITVLNLDEVVNSTLELLDKTLHPYTSAIFILNKVEDKYQLYSSQGLEAKDIIFTSESKLITFLKNTKDPAVIKQIDGIIGVSPEIAGEMARLKAAIVLPLILHSDLIGFISLGKKKSDEEYTKDDLDVLLDLARTESIAVGNAQLITEAAQSERRAAIGTMAAGIYHEIGNPLNIINTKIQVFLVGIQRGFYNDMSRDEIIQECKNILNDTLSQTNRIADITRRLSNFAKPSKEFKPQLINIPEEIDEAIAVVSHNLELERIKIDKLMPLDLPQVLADRQELQQIFFNLIRNAAQAISQTGVITVKALATQDSKVRIEIQDTGEGISEDKRKRIFEPFFTTKGPKGGTGLGLSIVRQLVWRNRGEISFNSLIGIGTTFILEFPKGA